MIDVREIEMIECLEQELLARGFSLNELVRCYSMFLLRLIQNQNLEHLPKTELQKMGKYLETAITPGVLEMSRHSRNTWICELWPLERVYKESNPAMADFVRCVICCFGNEADWDSDNTGDATPLWYYLFYIKKIFPEASEEFFAFFRRASSGSDGSNSF
jgi:hypothetical protein